MLTFTRVPTRLIGAATIAVMVLGTGVGAHAATKKRPRPIIRVVKLSYQGGCGITAGAQATPGQCIVGESYNLALRRGEKFISIAVADDNMPDVPAVLWLGTGVNAPNQQFCSSIKNFPAAGTRPQLDLFDGVDPSC